jgi:methionyl-tRNA formyltransferase
MRLVFAGTPPFARSALEALLAAGHDVALVLTQPDRPSGRGLKPKPSAVKELAGQRGLPLAQPPTLRAEETQQLLAGTGAPAMVVAAYGLILPQAVLDLFPLGCINIHASLLPRWRGAAPIQRAILAGDTRTGISIMRMEAGLDTGPVYFQESLAIDPDDTAASLHDKLAALGAACIVRALGLIEAGATPQPQPQAGVTYAHKIEKAEAELDWAGDALQLDRQVRAFNPFPVATTRLRGEPLRVWQARPLPGPAGTPGLIRAVETEGLLVECGSGLLLLEELQRAGGRRLAVRELLAGFRIAPGERLGELPPGDARH